MFINVPVTLSNYVSEFLKKEFGDAIPMKEGRADTF
jgi:hypothetical protein